MKGLVLENKKVSIKEGLTLPSPKKDEVLIKVKYATVNPTDLDTIEGKYGFLLKLMGGKSHAVNTGLEFSGVVEKDGKRFKKGDKVFGYVDLYKGIKTHQEYITINEDFIALMPSNLGFNESAAIPLGALTTLVALQDLGQMKKNTELLINGASGGLGVYAIQIAKILGARITAMAGPNQAGFLKSLGADKVIDYKEQKLKDLTDKFDVILDLTSLVKYSEIRNLLSKNGKFIPANPLNNMTYFLGNIFRAKKVKYLMVGTGNYEKLTLIAKWVEEGKLKPIVDSVYAFSDYENAFKRVSEKGRRGRIILKIDEN